MVWWFVALMACSGEGSDPGKDAAEDSDIADTIDVTDPGLTEYEVVNPQFPINVGEFEGYALSSHIPDGAVGVVFLFHGTGGDGPNVVDTVEMIAVLNELVANGIGFIAPTSENRAQAVWDVGPRPADNSDFQRLVRLRDGMIAAGAITAELPLFAMGFSNGGSMASYFGNAAQSQGWPVRGVLIHNMTGNGGYYRDPPDLPTMWMCSRNDEKVDFGASKDKYDEHVDAGNVGVWSPHEVTLLEPLRFMRTGYFDRQESIDIFRKSVDAGYFDMEGNWLKGDDNIEGQIYQFTQNSDLRYPKPVNAVLKVVLAVHAINGEHAAAEASFCVDNL